MYCDGNVWQPVQPGQDQTCIMLPPSMAGQPCSRPERKKDDAKRVLHGHGFEQDALTGYSYWYSDLHGKAYCAEDGAVFLWRTPSSHVLKTVDQGPCKKIKIEYRKVDIYLTD
jgi:hypothetical protein